MPSLKDLRDRIDSVQSTKKITSAMKLVAGARLKKAQTEAESSRPYASKMQTIIDNVTSNISNLENAPEIIKGKENNKTHLIVLMTSDRGQCGGFNTAITKMAKKKIRANSVSPGFTKTSFFKSFKKDKKKLYSWTLSRIPQNRWGESKEISELIYFLISENSNYINGENIKIDGGWLSA